MEAFRFTSLRRSPLLNSRGVMPSQALSWRPLTKRSRLTDRRFQGGQYSDAADLVELAHDGVIGMPALELLFALDHKTAQRIIVDLKDKIKTGSVVAGNAGTIGTLVSAANAQVQEEAVAALTMLGFAQAPSQKVVLAILKEEPSAPVEQVIKLALKDYNIYLKQIMTTINMQYWLGANERTHVLPTDKWYLDFATSILPLVKTSPLFNKEDLRTQIDAAISLGMYFQDAIAQSGGWKLFSEAFQWSIRNLPAVLSTG